MTPQERYSIVAREMLAARGGVPEVELRRLLRQMYDWHDQEGGDAPPLVAALIEVFEATLASMAGP